MLYCLFGNSIISNVKSINEPLCFCKLSWRLISSYNKYMHSKLISQESSYLFSWHHQKDSQRLSTLRQNWRAWNNSSYFYCNSGSPNLDLTTLVRDKKKEGRRANCPTSDTQNYFHLQKRNLRDTSFQSRTRDNRAKA